MSEDIGIASTAQNNEPLVVNAMVQSLNKKRKEFFQHT